jgi:murein DD-endopeptidase MepM/ murein hydrolase activator NlpD
MKNSFIALLIMGAVFFLFLRKDESPAPDLAAEPVTKHVIEEPAEPQKDTAVWKHLELQRGEGIFQVLQRLNTPHSLTMDIINTLRFNADLTALRVGEKFSVRYDRDTVELREFQYIPNKVTRHSITIDPETQSAEYKHNRYATETRHRMLQGTLAEGSSLNASLLNTGLGQGITSIVNNILLCKVAFRSDARRGDTFTVFLKEEYYNDTLIPEFTQVLYTDYRGERTGKKSAYRYEEDDENSIYNGHYTRSGQALIHSAVRYPLDRLHVSSSYGWRRHPVTGRRAFHNGIDYAISYGSPVYAVAPGKVVTSGYDNLSGNKVAIRHSDGTVSYYLHLSKRLVSPGQSVYSRQIIGRVGSTGRSTGPHLHLGFKDVNGTWMNPNNKRMIATQKLKEERFARLDSLADHIDSIMDYFHQNQQIAFFDADKTHTLAEEDKDSVYVDES